VKDSTRRKFLQTGGVVGIAGLTGCSQITGENDIKDTDGDGVIDSEDYAPRDASVQDAEDVQEAESDNQNEEDDGSNEQNEIEETQSPEDDSESTEFEPFTVTVDSKSTFLRKNITDSPNSPPIISLSDRNIRTGNRITLETSGTISISDDDNRRRCRTIGVFSRTNEIRGIDQQNRVPGAINAGEDFESEDTSANGRTTDIPEDFAISGGQNRDQCVSVGTTVLVPSGTNYLILGIVDSAYSDNSGELTIEVRPA
jgi:hypothetical protein